MIFSGLKNDEGSMDLTNVAKYREFIARFKPGQLFHVEIKPWRKKASPKQNAYLHLSLRWLGFEVGITEEEMKEEMKWKFLRYTDPVTGLEKTKNCRDLDTDEERIFIDKIDNWAIAFLGYGLPPPKKIDEALEMQR